MPTLGIDASRAIKQEKTGVEWYSYFLLRAMERCTPEGWKVRCYVPTTEPNGEWTRILRITNGNWQWRVLRWPVERGWIQGRLSLEMLAHPPDALFVPSRILPIVHPERTVTTIHDTVFLNHPELYDPHDLWLQKHGLDFALKFARKIIVPSRATRDEVVKAGAKEGQVVVVPHGVEIADIRNSILDISDQSEYPISNIKYPYILFIGRIEKKKNVLGLIHAFRRLIECMGNELRINPNITNYEFAIRNIRVHSPFGSLKLVLAGQLGHGSEDVLQAIKTFKLQDRVVQLGYVDRVIYRSLLHNAALLVLPSFGEGFGLPVLEAMATGTPVVCSDIPVLHEVGGNAVQYVNPRDPEDIARGIETVLQNEMLRSEMVRRGKELAQQFTWEKAAWKTWGVIQSW